MKNLIISCYFDTQKTKTNNKILICFKNKKGNVLSFTPPFETHSIKASPY